MGAGERRGDGGRKRGRGEGRGEGGREDKERGKKEKMKEEVGKGLRMAEKKGREGESRK